MRENMRYAIAFLVLTCALAKAGAQALPVEQDGLVVNQPKVYDNYYLQQQLQAMKAQLEALQILSGTTLTGKIGNIQGGTLNQTGVALQAGGPSTPSTKIITGSTSSNETDTTSLAPPAPSVAASSLGLPTPAIGSTDSLREMAQLQAQITGLQLLLDGAEGDKISPNGSTRRVLTFGFPISIKPANETNFRRRDNSVAIIEVSFCHVPLGPTNDLSIVTLLPRERTYDIAGLSDRSISASAGAVLGGVVSVGGGFLSRKQKYYAVQEQETVAVQNATAHCQSSTQVGTSFTWAIRPVLGKTQVRPGMQDGFVQLAMDNAPMGASSITACVRAGWVHQAKHDAVQDELPELQGLSCAAIPNFYTAPDVRTVNVHNAVGGILQIQARGTFLPGFRVHSGLNVLPDSAVQVNPSGNQLDIQIAAADFVRDGGLTVVGRNGESADIELKAPPGLVAMGKVTARVFPYSDTLSRITLDFSQPYDPNPFGLFNEPAPGSTYENPWIVTLDGTIYGLKDAPFLLNTVGMTPPFNRHIEFLAPTSALATAPPMELRRLLWEAGKVTRSISSPVRFASIAKTVPLTGGDELNLMLFGTNLDKLRIEYPAACSPVKCLSSIAFGSAVLRVDAATARDLKQIVFCQVQGAACDPEVLPLLLDVSSGNTSPAKPKLDPVTIAVGATTAKISGTATGTVSGVKYGGKAIPIHTAAGRLVLDLRQSALQGATGGSYPLVVTFADKTQVVYVLTVK